MKILKKICYVIIYVGTFIGLAVLNQTVFDHMRDMYSDLLER